MNGVAYRYDGNGNAISGDGRSFEYTSYDMVSKITKGTDYAQFEYGPDRGRWQRIDKKGSVITTTTYLGNIERVSTNNSSIVEWKRTIGGAVHTYRTVNNVLQANGSDKKYLYVDHLGSVDVITDGIGKVTHSMSFDAWGARRSGEDWTAQSVSQVLSSVNLSGFTQPITTRGYTGHEMVDDMGIIHMNGRIYDARIARFLQADPFIQAASNTQSFNRYSYVLNNPLNATDPSGFFFSKLKRELKRAWNDIRPFVGAIVAVVMTYFCGPYCGQAGYVLLTGAVSGAAGAAANGGNILRGAILGAFSSVAYIAGGAFGAAMWGGVHADIQGGNFGHGFLAAGIGALGGGDPGWGSFIRTTVLGGVATEITGGKFKNGAASAAFMYAVSAGVQRMAAGGRTTHELEGDPNSIDNISDDPSKTYAEGLKLAKDNPYVDGKEGAQYVDKIKLGKCISVDQCTQKKYFTSNAEAKEFMLNNRGWSQILGENSGTNTWIYRGATASGKMYFNDTVSALQRNSGVGCGCMTVSGAERVLSVLAHEGGHFAGLGHTNELYIREKNAIKYSRGLIK